MQRQTPVVATAAHAAAGLMLLAGSVPAGAQSEAAAVVCVGSELSTPRTPDPDRRFGWEGMAAVYRSDVALAYRVGVPLDGRQGAERALRSELGDHGDVSCTWSNRGDRHVAIIRYTSAIRLAPTSDPDGSVFRRLGIGFGASAEAAETNATTGNDHFARYYDGGGYEVLAREGWGAPDIGAAPGTADRPPAQIFEVFDAFRDCAFCPEMVVVPPGTFTMGSPESEEFRDAAEGPRHAVTIRAPFAVGVYEVTFAEWDACVRMGGCRYTPADRRRPGRLRFRGLSGFAADGPCSEDYGTTAPVGSFAPNAFGLYDVLGNVSEWTQDCWNDSYAGAPADGSAWEFGDCDRRVLRGGSWFINAWFLRSANRSRNVPDTRDRYYGFRVARTLP